MSYYNTSERWEEAERRLTSARVRDTAFAVRRAAGGSLKDADIIALAEAIVSVKAAHGDLTFVTVRDALLRQGRTKHASEHLAGLFFPSD